MSLKRVGLIIFWGWLLFTIVNLISYGLGLADGIRSAVIIAILCFWILWRRKKRPATPSPELPNERPKESRGKRQSSSEIDFPDFDDGQGSIFS